MKLIFLPLAFLAASLAATAADGPDPTVKLREQLRSTLLQLRTAQTETANLQAAQAAAEAKTKDLETKLAAAEARNAKLAKELNDDKAAAERSIATLNNKLAEREKRIVKYDEALAEWKAGYQKAAEVARTKEDERAALAAEVVVFKRTIADRETKNIALFNTANEILNRFENYALGKALGAREPFISTTRVKVENLVQGYQDKILEQRLNARTPKP
jgi:chromosome segregation ATPase